VPQADDEAVTGPRPPGPTPPTAARRVGRPPRINRQMIIDAARALDREQLTLQAVADRLGVDRKAISYHVAGRQELVDLVAAETIGEELGDLELPEDWRAAIRAWAAATRAVMLREGSMALTIDHLPGAGILGSLDTLLQRLLDAGFDEDTAGRALYCLTGTVFAGSRDTLLVERHGEHPTLAEVARVLGDLPAERLPHLRRLSFGDDPRKGAEDQARFDIDLVVAGLELSLDRRPR
jgi:TetR/AcrR family transcriptional regulator, tetracycline repressor protein